MKFSTLILLFLRYSFIADLTFVTSVTIFIYKNYAMRSGKFHSLNMKSAQYCQAMLQYQIVIK